MKAVEISSVDACLARAKANIDEATTRLQEAANDIASAREKGATQKYVASQLGKSEAWVSAMLKWRDAGFPTVSPFVASARRKPVTDVVQHAEPDASTISALLSPDQVWSIPETSEPPVHADLKGGTLPSDASVEVVSTPLLASEHSPTSNAQRRPGFTAELRVQLLAALNDLQSRNAHVRGRALMQTARIRSETQRNWDELLVDADLVNSTHAATRT